MGQTTGCIQGNCVNGIGIYVYDDGDEYHGRWKDGEWHGIGVLTFLYGDILSAVWEEGNYEKTVRIPDWYISFDVALRNASFKRKRENIRAEKERTERIAEEKRIEKEDTEMLQASSGTGFAVSYDGHIITNHHVIDACQEVKVRYKSDDMLAKLIAFDTVNDLAILKIDTKPSSVLPISYSNPEILQEIYVAGFPFGENVSTSIKMTKGIVSSLTGMGNNYSNIQIDAALQPGNSGGPVFDDKGNVVGVAVAKIDIEYAIKNLGVIPENTNFGIKSSVVINFLESNSIGNLASPLDYKASMTALGKSVTDATYYVSCMMTMAQIRKVQARKVIYSELIK